MSIALESLNHKVQRTAVGTMVDVALAHVRKDRQKTFAEMVDVAKQFYGDSFSEETYEHARAVLTDADSKWSKLINCVLDQTAPSVARTTALNLGYEAFFRGTKTIRENRTKYHCNIPWLILFDPTSACNMHCVGCWAGEYGHKNNLSFEDMDKIITEGKELGVYLYMLTGGEPLVRKADILRLAKKHNDVQFAIYTNSTLIDEPFCEEVVKLGNIAFMLSIEGTPSTNDARRGDGHYAAVMNAMDLLKAHGILFGTSICYTRDNLEAVTSDHFMRMLCDKGAHFGFYFHYMPVGNEAAPEVELDGLSCIGTIEIPSLDIKLPVTSEFTYDLMKLAPCRYSGSVYKGNMVIAAHNSWFHFGRIHSLDPGSQVVFTDALGNHFEYRVVLIETLTPDSVEDMTSSDYPLTLFTCTLDAKNRVTVRCK